MKIDLSDRKNMFYWQTNRPLTAEQTKQIFIERHENIDEVTLRRIVKQGMSTAGYKEEDTQIGEVRPIIKRGSVNSVIPVILQSGRKIVLRIHPKNVKNGYFWVEKTAVSLARREGVATYEALCVDDSQTTVPFDFMIMTAVAGKPMTDHAPLSPDLEKTLVTETGRYAGMIHNIHPDGFGFFDNRRARETNALRGQYASFKDHLYAALSLDLSYLTEHKVLSPAQGKNIERLFGKNEHLMECGQGSLIHNDIADWNEMTDGNHITGIMDWDECFSGDPLMELAAYSLFYGEPRLSWFKEGYKQVAVLEDNEDKFQLFKLRYLVSKMHLRTKRSTIDPSPTMKQNMVRGMKAMGEVFAYFRL